MGARDLARSGDVSRDTRRGAPRHTPEGARPTDATVDRSAREEAGRRLARGRVAREAAGEALVRSLGSDDARDTGSQLPSDAARTARDAARVARRLRERGRADANVATTADSARAPTDAGGGAWAGDARDAATYHPSLGALPDPSARIPGPPEGTGSRGTVQDAAGTGWATRANGARASAPPRMPADALPDTASHGAVVTAPQAGADAPAGLLSLPSGYPDLPIGAHPFDELSAPDPVMARPGTLAHNSMSTARTGLQEVTSTREPRGTARSHPTGAVSRRSVAATPAPTTDVTPRPALARPARDHTTARLRRDAARQAAQRTALARRGADAGVLGRGSATALRTRPVATAAMRGSAEAVAALVPAGAALALMLVLLVLVATLLLGGAVDEDRQAGARLVAHVATEECAACAARGDWGHKGEAYSAYARGPYGPREGWSACLVTWCLGQAGFVDSGLVGRYGDAASYLTRFRSDPSLGEVHDWYGEAYAPVEGDLLVGWYADGTQHMGIVTGCDGTRFTTVEGDVAGGPDGLYDCDEEDGLGGYVAARIRLLGEYSYTFIHPNYSAEAVAGA